MKLKLIMESWRSFLKEEEEGYEASQRPVLQDLLKKEYKDFVASLQQEIKDPKFQRFLKMGIEKYDGNSADDEITVEKVEIPVKNLIPTQSQIGLADSLGWTSKNNPENAGKTAAIGTGVPDVGGPIVTANGKFIVDGHHRWSQISLLNPEAKIGAYNFKVGFKGRGGSGKSALKLAHLAIAAVDGAVPLQPADAATDVYATGGDAEAIKKMLDSPRVVGDKMAASLQEAWGLSSRDEVIAKIAEHAISLYDRTKKPANTGPERGLMPQTGELSKPEKKMKAMAQGAVNWNPKA
jgi:hypothetical protein